MNIYGIGTDIISIKRIKLSLKKKISLNVFIMKKKFKSVKKQLIIIIALLKGLLQKKLFQKHLVLAFQMELILMKLWF